MILRNQGICPDCGDFVASISRHDYRSCKCGQMAIDGGPAYLRRLGIVDEQSICISKDVSYALARRYIAILFALDGKSWTASAAVMLKMKQQAKKMPWLPFPTYTDQLRHWLSEVVKEDLIEEKLDNKKQLHWRSKVKMAPWVDRADAASVGR